MTKPVSFTKAAIKRAIAAAQEQGAAIVEVLPDGTIRVVLRNEYQLAADRQQGQTREDDPWGHAEA
jgi:hypothetical protein